MSLRGHFKKLSNVQIIKQFSPVHVQHQRHAVTPPAVQSENAAAAQMHQRLEYVHTFRPGQPFALLLLLAFGSCRLTTGRLPRAQMDWRRALYAAHNFARPTQFKRRIEIGTKRVRLARSVCIDGVRVPIFGQRFNDVSTIERLDGWRADNVLAAFEREQQPEQASRIMTKRDLGLII